MEQDLVVLQNISETLKDDPRASQRTLAKNANMSLGMMNAVLGRFVERGWIMLSNVNARKLAYAITADGISELTERSKNFAKRTFKIASDYNDVLTDIIIKAKTEGKKTVVLVGNSYIKFLIIYICKVNDMFFEEMSIEECRDENKLYILGELEDSKIHFDLTETKCVSLLKII